MKKPIIAITMGDACGIGSELIAKILSAEDIYEYCCPFVIGKPEVMKIDEPMAEKAVAMAEAIEEASGTPVLTSPLLAIQALKKIIE